MITIKSNVDGTPKSPVKPFRKNLKRRLRANTATLRVIGSRGEWFLAFQVNETLHRLPAPYITLVTATLAGVRKFGVKATQYKAKTGKVAA